MAAVCSVGTTPFDVKGLKKNKSTFFLLVAAFLLNRTYNFFLSVDCFGVILQSFVQVGVEMGKEGIGSFPWDICGTDAFLAGLLDALVFFC